MVGLLISWLWNVAHSLQIKEICHWVWGHSPEPDGTEEPCQEEYTYSSGKAFTALLTGAKQL